MDIADQPWSVLQFYSSFTAYPKEVRDHLRAALRSAATGLLPRADASFATAYEQAAVLAATGHLGTPAQALQRTTGIVTKWGGMWEQAGQFERAAEVYQVGWEEVKEAMAGREVGEDGVMRGAGLAMKLGDCWVRLGRARDQEAEKAYSWAVQEMMRLGMSDKQKVSILSLYWFMTAVFWCACSMHKQRLGFRLDCIEWGRVAYEADRCVAGSQERVRVEMETGKAEELKDKEANKDDSEFDLPKWDGKTELVAGFERLAELYARMGKVE